MSGDLTASAQNIFRVPSFTQGVLYVKYFLVFNQAETNPANRRETFGIKSFTITVNSAGSPLIQSAVADAITEKCISDHLTTKNIPDPELLIRTSGEFRVSNFLLWQIAYTEFVILDVYWPDFSRKHLYDAVKQYQKRERRFGKVSEQIHNSTVDKHKKDSPLEVS